VLSGNRNFEGRVNPLVKANYLASPPLVVAYALAGTTDIDLTTEPLGQDPHGQPYYPADIWPTRTRSRQTIARRSTPDVPEPVRQRVRPTRCGTRSRSAKATCTLGRTSTYIQEPPFLVD
jgi:aconitate hydratase